MASAATAALGIGYLINDLDHDVMAGLSGMARVLAVVAAVALLQWLGEIHTDRRLAQQDRRLAQMRTEQAAFQALMERMLDARLERQRQWRAYSDVLTDLAGIDGESSTDSGRMPPRS